MTVGGLTIRRQFFLNYVLTVVLLTEIFYHQLNSSQVDVTNYAGSDNRQSIKQSHIEYDRIQVNYYTNMQKY